MQLDDQLQELTKKRSGRIATRSDKLVKTRATSESVLRDPARDTRAARCDRRKDRASGRVRNQFKQTLVTCVSSPAV